jgi:hypothetical protein
MDKNLKIWENNPEEDNLEDGIVFKAIGEYSYG